MRFAIAGKIRRGSSSTTCSSPITASCQSGGAAGAATGKRKRPGWGGTGPLHSHASVWGTLGGYRVLPEMVSDPLNVKNPPAKSCAEAAKPQNYFVKKISRKRRIAGVLGPVYRVACASADSSRPGWRPVQAPKPRKKLAKKFLAEMCQGWQLLAAKATRVYDASLPPVPPATSRARSASGQAERQARGQEFPLLTHTDL